MDLSFDIHCTSVYFQKVFGYSSILAGSEYTAGR